VRLLAETGLVGFFLFVAFQLSLLGDALAALNRSLSMWRYVGMAALFTWLSLLIYNMTQDSFATPNLWINLGMLAGLSGFSPGPGPRRQRV
jgi:O-antigen ligase